MKVLNLEGQESNEDSSDEFSDEEIFQKGIKSELMDTLKADKSKAGTGIINMKRLKS
jgi:hypothetical protein